MAARRPLVLSGLLLALSLSSARAQYVSITLGPGRAGGPQPDLWEPAVRRLLEDGAKAEWVAVVPARQPRLRVTAKGWSKTLSAEERGRGWAALKEVWGNDVRLEQAFYGGAPAAVPAQAPAMEPRALLDRKSNQELVERGFELLISGRADSFFDRTAASRGGAGTLPVAGSAGGQGSGLARPAVAAAAPGAAAFEDPAAKPRPFEVEIAKAAMEARIDPEVLRAVVAAKSGFNANRKGGDAYGLMGISVGAARVNGLTKKDLFDPAENLNLGAKMLGDLIDTFKDCPKSDADCRARPATRLELHRALAAYQVGPREVAQSRGIPNDPFVKAFIAAFELAYATPAPAQPGPRKAPPPPATGPKVTPPPNTIEREMKEAARQKRIETLPPSRQVPQYMQATVGWRPMLQQAATSVNKRIDENLYLSIIQVESEGIPEAIGDNPTPRKGRKPPIPSCGLGQIKPTTANGYLGKEDYTCEDLLVPETNLKVMVLHFEGLKRRFGLYGAVSAYNQGEGAYRQDGADNTTYLSKVSRHYRSLTGKTPW